MYILGEPRCTGMGAPSLRRPPRWMLLLRSDHASHNAPPLQECQSLTAIKKKMCGINFFLNYTLYSVVIPIFIYCDIHIHLSGLKLWFKRYHKSISIKKKSSPSGPSGKGLAMHHMRIPMNDGTMHTWCAAPSSATQFMVKCPNALFCSFWFSVIFIGIVWGGFVSDFLT